MQGDKKPEKIEDENNKQLEETDGRKEKIITEDEILDSVVIEQDFEAEVDLSESLKLQVKKELQQQEQDDNEKERKKLRKKKIKKRILWTFGIIFASIILFAVWVFGTKSGRKLIYHFAGNVISDQVDYVDKPEDNTVELPEITKLPDAPDNDKPVTPVVNKPIVIRQEDYVSNYLIFGIEEIENASNTDSMMIASINTKDDSIKLTSLLRDTYIEIPGVEPTKLNAVYARGGADQLVHVVEQSYRIKIDGYAHINFESFEEIIDRLGGISIELGEEEAHYLNTTNYISNRANRNVEPGWNELNGNQALGYCRVRKCVTLGGANDDYGRTLRQRRVLKAIFNKYKSQNLFDLISTMNDCLGYVKTNMKADQFGKSLEAIVENKITNMDTSRMPANNLFEAYDEYNGVDDPLVLDWEENIAELYQFIYLDTEAEALAAVNK
jgi:LCP family protein required for cell wall assembly